MTKEFVMTLDARPGSLVEVLSALAKENVNVRGAFGANVGDFDTFHMVVDEESRAERVLRDTHAKFRAFDVVITEVENKPGALLAACDRLASASINLDAIYTLASSSPGKATVAFRVKDARAAEAALKRA